VCVCSLPLRLSPPPSPKTTHSSGTSRSADTQGTGPARIGPRRVNPIIITIIITQSRHCSVCTDLRLSLPPAVHTRNRRRYVWTSRLLFIRGLCTSQCYSWHSTPPLLHPPPIVLYTRYCAVCVFLPAFLFCHSTYNIGNDYIVQSPNAAAWLGTVFVVCVLT